MIRQTCLLLALTVAVCLTACTPQPVTPAVDLAEEAQAIRDASAKWLAAAQMKDWAGAAANFAPDGVAFPMNKEPLTGPAAIQASMEAESAAMPDASLRWSTDNVVVAASGDLAYETGSWTMSSAEKSDTGKYITVWRKLDGQWKVIGDMGVSTTPVEADKK